jgi:flagellar biogenesis protein FliO
MQRKIINHLRKGVLLAGCLLVGIAARGQVQVSATIDSTQIWMGQQVGIRLEVDVDKGAAVEFPVYDSLQQVTNGVEFLRCSPGDTQHLNEGQRWALTRTYYVTSFDSAIYYLPPMKVGVNGKTYETNSLALKVYAMDVDTLHADSVFGMKDVVAPPFEWQDFAQMLWLSLAIVLLVIVVVYVAVRLKNNQPIISYLRRKRRVAPHVEAMQKIDDIKRSRPSGDRDSKVYYTELTDALRGYIDRRYGFNATQMTTAEIISHLADVNDDEALQELRSLFETADLVKFAKYHSLLDEDDRNLLLAVQYINETKQEEQPDEQKEEVTVVNQRSLNVRRWLFVGMFVAVLCLLGLIGYVGWKLWIVF